MAICKSCRLGCKTCTLPTEDLTDAPDVAFPVISDVGLASGTMCTSCYSGWYEGWYDT